MVCNMAQRLASLGFASGCLDCRSFRTGGNGVKAGELVLGADLKI